MPALMGPSVSPVASSRHSPDASAASTCPLPLGPPRRNATASAVPPPRESRPLRRPADRRCAAAPASPSGHSSSQPLRSSSHCVGSSQVRRICSPARQPVSNHIQKQTSQAEFDTLNRRDATQDEHGITDPSFLARSIELATLASGLVPARAGSLRRTTGLRGQHRDDARGWISRRMNPSELTKRIPHAPITQRRMFGFDKNWGQW